MNLPSSVKIVEVGPRDGLQDEKQPLATDTKIELVHQLAGAGVSYIEVGSFVNPRWVPQMAGSDEVFQQIERKKGVTYAGLVPNMQGYQRAVDSGVTEVAIFAAVSEAFSQKNTNCTVAESIERFAPIMSAAANDNVKVRGYVSCVVGCPYEGDVAPQNVADVARQLFDMGCYEISLCDTIGVGTPASVSTMLEATLQHIQAEKLAVHLHDTYGQALANIYASLQLGIATIDSSVAGLGGCPFAVGASGNVATEDVIYMLDGLGIEHGIDLNKLLAAGDFISRKLGKNSGSKVACAMLKSG